MLLRQADIAFCLYLAMGASRACQKAGFLCGLSKICTKVHICLHMCTCMYNIAAQDDLIKLSKGVLCTATHASRGEVL